MGRHTSSNRWYSSDPQIAWTCKALMNGRKVSHKSEIREVNGWCLSAIVHRLKDEYGWPIRTEYRGQEHITYYSPPSQITARDLRFPQSAKALTEGGWNERG